MKRLIWLLLLPAIAFGQTKISQLPVGSAPAGSELIPMVQGGSTVTTTPLALIDYGWTSNSPGSTGTYCLNWTAVPGVPTPASCPGGTPGGLNGYIQYNNSGAFGGFAPGTGVVTWLETPTIANLNAALSVTLAQINGSLTTGDCTNVANGTSSQIGDAGKPCGNVPSTTFTSSHTVASTDMGAQDVMNVSGGGTLTIPAISSSIFASGMTLRVVNYSASTLAISTTPTINAGGGCVTATGVPTGDTWVLISNGTTLDCTQTQSAGGATLQTGGTNNTSQTLLNLTAGGGISVTNPSGGQVTVASSYTVRNVTGSTDTILSTDCANGVYYSYAGSVAVTLPQATSAFATCGVDITASSATTVTVTPTTSTINGASSLLVNPSLWSQLVADSGNYVGYGTAVSFDAGVTYLLDEGTKFTVASGTGTCATTSTTVGGTAVGSFLCTGTSGAATVTITLPTAPNAIWKCGAFDATTTTDTLTQTGMSATSVTFSASALVANDKIVFGSCTGS
jgi:hypothetical protein